MQQQRFFIFFLFFPTFLFSQIDHWETAIYAGDNWHYRAGTTEPPADWTSVDFDDSSWPEGEGSIGYGDGDDNTIIAPVESLYMRRKFMVTDESKIALAAFHADFDDGFVAYLNGVEIARTNLEGNPPPHDAWTPDLREARMYDGGLPVVYYLYFNEIQDLLNNGENVLAIQTHNFEGTISSDLTTLYWLSFGINDQSNDYGPTPTWFNDIGFETPLPIVKINTWGEYIPDEPSIDGEMGIVWNGNGNLNSSFEAPNEFLGKISIERRGQSSQSIFPKNGYGIETKDENGEDLDVQFLNFPEEEDWILHGPYSDKTLIRNVLAMHMANGMGQYASRTRLVELLINEQYEGVYVLMEKIKRDKNRVDIANLKPEDITGDELTGGYVFKIDKGEPDWYSEFDMVNLPGEKLRFQYVSPNRSNIQPEQEEYIQSYVDSFENAMLNPEITYGGKRYDEYMDMESFADHFIISELTKNVDAYRISSYYYKDKDSNGGLIKAGPVWDFNIAIGNADYCSSDTEDGWVYNGPCGDSNPFWWNNMLTDPAFVSTLKCRWTEFREGPFHLDSLFSFVDEKVELLAPVIDRNFERWPVLNEYVWPNPVVTGSYEGEIEFMKNFIEERIQWMDENVFGTCAVNGKEEIFELKRLKVYPNPVSELMTVVVNSTAAGNLELTLFNVLGQKVLIQEEVKNEMVEQEFHLILSKAENKSGIYFLQVKLNGKLLGGEQIIFE